jgi:DNA-binding GntR family transcriptional regulator
MKAPDSEPTHGLLPEHAYERLRDLIVRGRIPPGARVREAEVALRFGVSRTPVREALLRLLHERFLVPVSQGRRTELIAAPFNSAEIRELWAIIGALESVAIAVVADMPKAARAAMADELHQLNAALVKAARQRPRNADRLFELQTAFHVRFVKEGGGPHLLNIYESLRPQVQRYEWIYGTRPDADYEPSSSEHTRIIAAIREGNVELARLAVIAHWEKAAKRTAKVVDAVDMKLPSGGRARPPRNVH